MKAIVYKGIQKVQCREVPDPKIEKEDDIKMVYSKRSEKSNCSRYSRI